MSPSLDQLLYEHTDAVAARLADEMRGAFGPAVPATTPGHRRSLDTADHLSRCTGLRYAVRRATHGWSVCPTDAPAPAPRLLEVTA